MATIPVPTGEAARGLKCGYDSRPPTTVALDLAAYERRIDDVRCLVLALACAMARDDEEGQEHCVNELGRVLGITEKSVAAADRILYPADKSA